MQPNSSREKDHNGWAEVKKNPLSKVGIFQYSGGQIGADPSKIYNVYRPEDELSNEETIKSFRLLPWVDEHVMLGDSELGLTPAEKKGIQGVIGQDVYFEDGTLYGNIKVFSESLSNLIESGKKQLSVGYRCIYDMVSGVWNGQPYDAIQRNIRGNHLALVQEGRMGKEVSVLDHFKFTFDTKELFMEEEAVKKDEAKKEMTLAEAVALLEEIVPQVQALTKLIKDKEEIEEDAEIKEIALDEGDKEDGKKDENKISAMDSALRSEFEEHKRSSMKTILSELSSRDDLANKLSKHIGTFDCADKTLKEVAEYGVSKLGISCPKGSETVALDGYLFGREAPKTGYALNSTSNKTGGLLKAHINNNK